jgi:primosomal protein N' (replication factor Y)
VVGRAGRGETSGQAIVQTLVPEHAVLQLAAKQDYDSFYDLEIRMRQAQNCPPFADLVEVTFTGQEETAVLRSAAKFRESLLACLRLPDYQNEYCTVLGPAPCPVMKINYNYRYRLTLRCRMGKQLRLLLAHLLRQFALDKANRGVNAFADVNGYDA